MRRLLLLWSVAAVVSTLLSGCAGVLDPQGPRAQEIYDLWWLLFVLGTVVFLLTMAALAYALVRPRRETEPSLSRDPVVPVVIAGGVLPAIILIFLTGANLKALTSAYQAENAEPNLTIEVIGHMWWWEVRYPEQGFVTANEVHIPVGRTVRLELTSADVIHSFWVPQLQGKMDLNPGIVNTLTLEASREGVFRGYCAEFCGLQHANMRIVVVAQSEADFDRWVARQRQEAPAPTDERAVRGLQLFLDAACGYCHAIRGTEATGTVGPDLTHVAGRRTLGAATIANSPGNLAAWVGDPHAFKPGVFMPRTTMPAEDFEALLEYLSSLE
jgi:cytochrome c oxidase subunit II